MKTVYILLTKSSTLTSRIIGHFTNDPYTHSSLAFDPSLSTMYSFARRYSRFPLPAGLVEEKLNLGFFRRQNDIPCSLLTLDVTDDVYEVMQAKIEQMLCRKRHYQYSVIGLLACKLHIPFERHGKYFCSQFIAKLLEECHVVSLPKNSALMRPADFLSMDCFTTVFTGGLVELKNHLAALTPNPVAI